MPVIAVKNERRTKFGSDERGGRTTRQPKLRRRPGFSAWLIFLRTHGPGTLASHQSPEREQPRGCIIRPGGLNRFAVGQRLQPAIAPRAHLAARALLLAPTSHPPATPFSQPPFHARLRFPIMKAAD